jgi:predicted TIM-barrel fold metal-dependent hydrolase
MQVIDSDGHLHEPFDLFERYIEKDFYAMRPRVVEVRDEPRDEGRWLVEGRLVPRLPFTKGVGGGGFRYQTPRHSQMKARDNSLDDIEGRLQDLDQMAIDFQVLYPTALVWVFDLENKELAAAVCRAYNNYVAEQCARVTKRLGGVALLPIQDPPAAVEEARRAIQKLGLRGVVIPGIVGKKPLHAKEFIPFFETMNELNAPIGFHAVTGMHYTPWADCFSDFFSTHVTAMPFSMMVAMMSMVRSGMLKALPRLRCAFLEIGASWLPYWNWWVGKHIEHVLEPRAGRQESNWGREPYELPSTVHEPLEDILEGRILSGFETDENLRSIIDQLGSKALMYASDYPHSDMEWNRVQAIKGSEALTGAEKADLLGGNACRFYNLQI